MADNTTTTTTTTTPTSTTTNKAAEATTETDILDSDNEWQVQRDAAKTAGDNAFRSADYTTAVEHYTQALSLDPEHGALLSNRSAAHLKLGHKSKALHDAVACKASMGLKGISRHAAALQALGRYEAAVTEWESILRKEPQHIAALAGKEDCQKVLQKMKEQSDTAAQKQAEVEAEAAKEEDDLDDFFNDVEDAVETVVEKRIQEAAPVEAIKSHKKDLGTAAQQVDRLLPKNYEWYNLNPFHVLDIAFDAPLEEISRRYKALSLLLHPDKNPNLDRAELAYDQVLTAKAILYDETKSQHVRKLVEQGMREGQDDFDQAKTNAAAASTTSSKMSMAEHQTIAVQRLFAQREHTRRRVEERERSFHQREQDNEDAEAKKVKNERKFDKDWREEERVDKRIGNWRDFAKTKKKKT